MNYLPFSPELCNLFRSGIPYKKDNGSCMCLFELHQGLSWRQAQVGCSKLGAHLPEINSDKENRDIYESLKVNFFLLLLSLCAKN